MSGWCTLMACSSSKAFSSIRFCMILLLPEHPPPRGPLNTLLSACGIEPRLPPTLLLIDGMRLYLLRSSSLPDLLQQLPPRIGDLERRTEIVIRKSLPFAQQVLGLLVALQHIVVD